MTGAQPLASLILDAQTGFACGETDDDGIAQVRMNNVDVDGHLDLEVVRRVPARLVDLAKFRLEEGDILFNNTNSPELVGKTAWFNGWSEPIVFSNHFTRLRTNPRKVDPRYVARWLTAQRNLGVFTQLCNQWVNQASVRKEALFALKVPLPRTVAEQSRIADILDKADAIRRQRAVAIALSDELLRCTFLEMVGPAARDYAKWERKPLGTLAAAKPNAMRTGPFGSDLRHSEFVEDGVAVLGIDNAVQNRFAWGERRYITKEKYEKLRRYTVLPDDVIVTIMGTTGRSAVIPRDIPTAITTKHLATITLDRDQAEPEFLSQALFRHPDLLEQIAAANRGAIMSGLNLGLIKSLRIAVPPLSRQRDFARITTRLRAAQGEMEHARVDTDALFASLSERAFRQGRA